MARSSGRGSPGLTLIMLDARTGEERIFPALLDAAAFDLFDFSPDGSSIVINAGTSPATAVPMLYAIADRTALRPKKILPMRRGMKVWDARFSPNGRWLAISAVPDSMATSTLYVAGVSGGDPAVQITDGTAFDETPRWSFDGESLYFISNRATPGNIRNVWAIRMDSEKGRPVGSPFGITSLTNPGIPDVFRDLRITRDRLVMPLVHTSGNIWMLENLR
jgi:hypothetical protein